MRVEKVDFDHLKSEIEELYKDNMSMTPYQSYEFLKITGKGHADTNPFEELQLKELTYILCDDNECPIIVAPLLIKKEHGTSHIYFKGQLTSAAHLNFIYKSNICTYEMFSMLMDTICAEHTPCKLYLSKIPKESPTCAWIERKYIGNCTCKVEECVTIKLPHTYDEWFNSLSKSTRQNIRTAYNRLSKENISLDFSFVENTPIAKKELSIMLDLYTKRLIQKKTNNRFMMALAYCPLRLMKAMNPMTRALTNMTDSCHSCLKFNNKLAASLWALSCNDGRLMVPRLSYNNEWKVYCPGGILIAETIKAITTNAGKYTELDLSCGNEMYKYTYGGTVHYNNSYAIMFNTDDKAGMFYEHNID